MSGITNTSDRLRGKVVLISGAASDIGVAIAARCIAEGASVVCADLDGTAAARTATQLGPAAQSVQCDVTDIESARAAVELTRARFGRLDGFVHNAAAPGTTVPWRIWRRRTGIRKSTCRSRARFC